MFPARLRQMPPPVGAIINSGSSLTNGLIASIRPQVIRPASDVYSINGGTWTQAGNVPGFSSQIGESWGQLSTSGGLYGPTTKSLSIFSLAWYGVALTFQSGSPFISQITPENAGTVQFMRFGDISLAKERVQVGFAGSGLNGNRICPTNYPLLIVAISTGTGHQLWINGVLDASDSVAQTTSQAVSLGFGRSNFGSRGLNGWHGWMAVWDRPLVASEIQTLSTNPWVLFELPSMSTLSSPSFRGWGIPV